ncbi:hypothetical protein AHiyo1_43010 [Arthrobacter sp. Hiyo1]|uniref:hypothetical protein n=1 Tax=Arthrobacter sp. Hiyo1 TaxID=1588020 RepID=UPI0006A3D9E0|nr:hypothetical protein [Arthrobacter sp. Hiyo1]GAP60720.1 hypothetical protein AHiyo1_43010 [Arthrobacter sp. Hiyo1]
MFGFRFSNGQAAALLAAAVLLTVPGCTGPGAGQPPATSGPASGGLNPLLDQLISWTTALKTLPT